MKTRTSFLSIGFTVAALGAGCASDPETPAATPDAGRAETGGGTGDGGAGGGCYSNERVDHAKYDYKPPRVQPGSCTEDDVTKIVAYAEANPDKDLNDLRGEVLANYAKPCHDCIFAVPGDSWPPILLRDDTVHTVNSSGCIQIVSKKGDACGKAHRQWDQCLEEACADCDGKELEDCGKKVQLTGGACHPAAEAMAAACGGGAEINSYLAACVGKYGFDEWIRKQCVTGS